MGPEEAAAQLAPQPDACGFNNEVMAPMMLGTLVVIRMTKNIVSMNNEKSRYTCKGKHKMMIMMLMTKGNCHDNGNSDYS